MALLLLASGSFAAESAEQEAPVEQAEPAAEEIDYRRLIFEAELLPAAADATPAGPVAAGAASRPDAAISPPIGAAPGNDAADIPRYENEISRALENAGPYSNPLREQYEALGELYQRSGDHEKAIANFESAMHIDRVNGGLFTLQQIPLVENIIESYGALADIDAVDDRQEYLYYIQLKSYDDDDPRLLAAKEAWADWNVQSYLKTGPQGAAYPDGLSFSSSSQSGRADYVAVQNPNNGNIVYVPRNQMPNVLNSTGALANSTITDFYMRSSTYAVSPEQIIDERLRRARDLYEEIIASPNEEYQSTRGVDAEHKLANISYVVKQLFDELEDDVQENSLSFNRFSTPRSINPVVTRGYSKSRESLEAIATRLEEDANSDPMQKAQAYIDLGDLHLGFDRASRGREAYAKALDILTTAQIPPAAIARLFNPKPLLPLPGFALHPFTREFFGMTPDAALDYKGYIDVTLAINQSGDVRDSRIVAATGNTPQRLRSVLLSFLREHRMRPVVQNGAIVDEYPMTLRIHYSY